MPGRNEVRIGFIGGSITGGALASDTARMYSTRLVRFLGNMYPKARFRQVNAGIGATNSRFGVSRVEDDLLAAKPDLIVIEFAVNDDHADPVFTAETMEGLIRKCLKVSGTPVILFQTMDVDGSQVNHGVQALAGAHYGLPVIGYHAALWPLVTSGQLPWRTLSPDNVHPNDTGHLACAYLLFSFLKAELKASRSGVDTDPGIPAPLAGDFFEHAGILKAGDSTMVLESNSGWIPTQDSAGRLSLASSVQGDRIAFTTSNREVTLLYHYAKDLDARMEVSLDGRIVDTLSNNFREDWGGGFLKPNRVYRNEDVGKHVLVLTNISGGKFDLRYLLYVR